MPGSIRSSTTRAGRSRSASESPSSPRSAVLTRNPAASRYMRANEAMFGSSSMISTCWRPSLVGDMRMSVVRVAAVMYPEARGRPPGRLSAPRRLEVEGQDGRRPVRLGRVAHLVGADALERDLPAPHGGDADARAGDADHDAGAPHVEPPARVAHAGDVVLERERLVPDAHGRVACLVLDAEARARVDLAERDQALSADHDGAGPGRLQGAGALALGPVLGDGADRAGGQRGEAEDDEGKSCHASPGGSAARRACDGAPAPVR